MGTDSTNKNAGERRRSCFGERWNQSLQELREDPWNHFPALALGQGWVGLSRCLGGKVAAFHKNPLFIFYLKTKHFTKVF